MLRSSFPVGLLLLCQQFQSSAALWPFSGQRFTGNSMISAGPLGIDNNGQRILAYGDFNGDQFQDVVTIDEDQQTFAVNLWNHEKFTFEKTFFHKHPMSIQNILPSDFNHDGKLDILVMSHDSENRIEMMVYYATHSGSFDTAGMNITASTGAQPIPIDIDGDLLVDLLGTDAESKLATVWHNVYNASSPTDPLFHMTEPPFTGEMPCESEDPHSNAVIDMDGDCLADIVIWCKRADPFDRRPFQIWTNNKASGFSLAFSGEIAANAGPVSFADMNRDGTMDMVYPTCSSIGKHTGVGIACQINIAFNIQKPLCSGTSFTSSHNENCRKPDELCTADPNFHFRFDITDPTVFVQMDLNKWFPELRGAAMLFFDHTFTPAIPQSIKLGDANLDGYPDILFVLAADPNGGYADQSGDPPYRIPTILASRPCAKGILGCDKNGKGPVGWTRMQTGVEALTNIKDALSVSFLDIDEDGTLDVVAQRNGKNGQNTISFVQNNFFHDAFFLKTIVLNGACGNGACTSNDSASYMPFGVSYSGASYKYTILDTSGGRSAAQAGQLPQTSYYSLQTPYAFIGLGRTNNYVENLFVGSTLHTNQHFINMEGVIPNSKVVFKPPLIMDGEQRGDWKKELYLRPGEWIPWVLLSVVGIAVVLGAIVLMLHISEKREDEKERKRASHMINFDAL